MLISYDEEWVAMVLCWLGNNSTWERAIHAANVLGIFAVTKAFSSHPCAIWHLPPVAWSVQSRHCTVGDTRMKLALSRKRSSGSLPDLAWGL
jgi:hypothetical protein